MFSKEGRSLQLCFQKHLWQCILWCCSPAPVSHELKNNSPKLLWCGLMLINRMQRFENAFVLQYGYVWQRVATSKEKLNMPARDFNNTHRSPPPAPWEQKDQWISELLKQGGHASFSHCMDVNEGWTNQQTRKQASHYREHSLGH